MTYQPMCNDRRDFDPMGQDWGYILDTCPPDAWRELVAVRERHGTWPFQVRGADGYRDGYFYARLSPDWAFYSWGAEYVGAHWNPARPGEVECGVRFQRRYTDPPRLDEWAGVITLDLREQASTWLPCPRDRARDIPADVTAEAGHKAVKLLAFFRDAIGHWQAGDQDRPVTAADLYPQEHLS